MPPVPVDVLNDLCSRFLINIPEEEKSDQIRICFQIELAHWFYIDFYRQEKPQLPECGMREFTFTVMSHLPFLRQYAKDVDKILAEWKAYKRKVPVHGAIILDESLDECLLVQGYYTRTSWGFPKGKVNEEEDTFTCAVREVIEETGFDIRPYCDPEDFLVQQVHEQKIQLYIAYGVSKSTIFQPKTRCEIKKIEWFRVANLPTHKGDTTPQKSLGLNPNNFFLVIPFVKPLRKWIRAKKGELTKKRDSQLGFVYPSLESMPPGMALQMRQTFDYASIHSQPLPPQHPAPRPVQNPESLLPFESWIQQQQQQQQVVTEEDARGRKRVRIRQIPAWNNFRFDYKNIMKHLS
ncbi:m7GpppN-mRNA hydrolase-like [Oscarella lobularis]|uniref:m7GpppN-mRNA hydrolase-like n=1 Tax=Oscarella lobularis TaxID=121494 RepID=UPI003313984D